MKPRSRVEAVSRAIAMIAGGDKEYWPDWLREARAALRAAAAFDRKKRPATGRRKG